MKFGFIVSLLLFTGCQTHLPNNFSGSNSYQQQLIIREISIPGENSPQGNSIDSLLSNSVSDEYNDTVINENELVETIDWEHRQTDVDEHRLLLDIYHKADSVSYEIRACGRVWDDLIRCSDMAYITVLATKGGVTSTYRDSVDLKLLNELFLLDRSDN